LSYYGQHLVPDQVPTPTKGGLAGVRELLKEHYGLETLVLRLEEPLPSTASIVELPGGSFGVLASPSGQQGWIVKPAQRTVGTLSGEQRRELAGRPALLPVHGGP
jgi:hypothetical protein